MTRGGEREREVKEETVMPRGARAEEREVQTTTECGRRRIMCRSCSPMGRGTVEGEVEECGWIEGRRWGRDVHSGEEEEEDLGLV